MKTFKLATALASLLALAGAAEAQTAYPLTGSQLHLVPALAPINDCASGSSSCFWFDSAAHAFRTRNEDGSYSYLIKSPTAQMSTLAGTEGNWTMGGQLNGASATVNAWFKYTPIDVTADSFWWNAGEFDVGTQARPDHIMNWGWNLSGGGGLVNSGTRRGAAGWQIEDYFEQTPGSVSTAQMEAHLFYVDPTGVQHRPISLLGALNAPYATGLYLDADQIVMGAGRDNNANASLQINTTTTTINAPSGPTYNTLILDDAASGYVRLEAGSSGAGTLRAFLQMQSSGDANLTTHGTAVLGDVGASQGSFRWDPGNTAMLSPDAHGEVLLADGTGPVLYSGGQPILFVQDSQVFVYNKLLYLQHDAIGTNTRGDQTAAMLMRNTTNATALAPQQFSPGATWTSYAWTGAASQATSFKLQLENTSGVTPGAQLVLGYSTDESNYTRLLSFDKGGGVDSANPISSLLIGAVNATSGSIGPNDGSTTFGQILWSATGPSLLGPAPGFNELDVYGTSLATQLGGQFSSAGPMNVTGGVLAPYVGLYNAGTFIKHTVPNVASSILAVLGAAQAWTAIQTFSAGIRSNSLDSTAPGSQLLLGNVNATLGNIGPSSQFYWNATRTAMAGTDGFSNSIIIQDGAAAPVHVVSGAATSIDIGLVTPTIQIGSGSAPGTCDASQRGKIYTTEGGAGVADITQQCLKSAADTYSWKTIVGG